MRFRLTDEQAWESAFEAGDADELVRGIASAWDARIEHVRRSPGATHPAFALAARVAEIDAWEADRMARPETRENVRAEWRGRAQSWRLQAARDLGGDEHASPLRLHVYTCDLWCTLAVRYPNRAEYIMPLDARAPRVARRVSAERAADLFAGALATDSHARSIMGMGGSLAAAALARPPARLTVVR